MLRSTVGKVMWVGRATVFLVGLAVILALVVGAASTALGANGQALVLGSATNAATALTKLTGNVAGKPAVQIVNPNTAAGSQALQLLVAAGKPPLVVNPTAGKATNLDADKVDGKNAADLLPGGTLPAGATVRGTYELDGTASAANQLIGGDSISFVYALPSTPSVRFVRQGATPPAECPGTSSDPKAQPGFLCIYENTKSNIAADHPSVYNLSRVGAGLFARSTGAGAAFSGGRWAATAHLPGQALSQESDAAATRLR